MDDKIGIAVIGAGYWGPNLIRNFKNLRECDVKWVCEKKPGRRRYIRETFPGTRLTSDSARVLNDPEVEGVVIATPISTHYRLARTALEMGKHVFVEKPLVRTSAEAGELVEIATRKERVLSTGHVFVYHPAVSEMKSVLDRGQVGRLCYAESGRVNLGPPASEVDVIWDLAVHDISILLFLWGQEPIEVTAYGRRFIHPSLIDAAFLHLSFADGSMSQHHVSWLSPERVRRFFTVGTRGSLTFDDTVENEKLRITDQGYDSRIGLKDDEAKELYYLPGEVSVPQLPEVEPLLLECRDFLDCIRNGGTPVGDGRSGLAVVRVLEAVERSIESDGRPVTLTPEVHK